MKLSLRMVLLIGVIGIQLLTVSGILLSSYLTTQDALLGHAKQLMLEVSNHVVDQSEQFLEPARITADLTRRLASSDVSAASDLHAMERLFFEELSLYPWFSGIYFGDVEGNFVFVKREQSTDDDTAFVTKIIYSPKGVRHVELIKRTKNFDELERREDPADKFDPRTRPWFKLAVKRRELMWTDPYIFFTSQQPGISATIPSFNADESEVQGAIGVDIEIGQLSSFLGNLKIGKAGSAFILNRNGDIIAHPQPDRITLAKTDSSKGPRFATIAEMDDPIARAAFSALGLAADNIMIDSPVVQPFEFDGRRYLSVFTPFFSNNWPWTMVIYVPEDDYLGLLNEQTRLNLYLGMAVAFFGCILTILIWHTIARPMRQLSADAEAVTGGNFEIEPQTTSIYSEVNAAGDAFRKMVIGLREHEHENLRLRRLQTRMMDNMRQSAVGHFASAVSHELNNPLAAVLTNLQIVSRVVGRAETPPTQRLLDAIDGARGQAERAGEIIRGLREMVEAGEAQRTEENVNQMLREAVELVREDENMANAQCVFDLASDLPVVIMNRVQVQQVVLNLVRNAIEAMADDVAPTIRIISSTPDADSVEIAIEDSGPGISSEVSEQLFQPMVTTKPTGMGIGLSICRTIVESHGGRMTVSRGAGGGARFSFTIATAGYNGQSHAGK